MTLSRTFRDIFSFKLHVNNFKNKLMKVTFASTMIFGLPDFLDGTFLYRIFFRIFSWFFHLWITRFYPLIIPFREKVASSEKITMFTKLRSTSHKFLICSQNSFRRSKIHLILALNKLYME